MNTNVLLLLLLLIHVGLFTVVALLPLGQELVTDGGFESSQYQEWKCRGCSMQRISDDAHTGSSALRVTSRRGIYSGPAQTIHLRSGTRYRIQAYVKQLNDDPSSSLFQRHSLRVTYTGYHHSDIRKVATRSMIRSVDGWFSMVGFFIVPNMTVISAELRLMGPEVGIELLVDDVSVREIAQDTDWETVADERIERLRKGDINIRFNLPSSIQPGDVSVQVDHKKHLFRFGSLVKDGFLLDPYYKGYQDIVYSLFNIATLQSFKWKFDKGTQYHPDFTEAVTAMHTLKAHGLEVRGHNMFWGFTKNLPTWVPQLSPDNLNQSVQDRLHHLVQITKGQLIQWDVVNELLHGQWFEEALHDPLFSERLFRQMKGLDPHATLMLNDFHVVSKPDFTDAYLQQAKHYLANGVPLDALGIQSHFSEDELPDPTLVRIRLDYLAQSNLPLWITELNLMANDSRERADLYERVFRLYFSHPAVQGIVLWGFWDQQAKGPEAALVDGFDYTLNEAGRRVASLIQDKWSTHVNQTLTSGSTSVNLRGFKGDYDLVVRVRDVPVKVQSFSLTGDSTSVTITLTGNEASVTIPPPLPTLVPLCPTTTSATSIVTHNNGDHSLGPDITSSASSPFLHCITRWSPESLLGDDQHTQVACQPGEVLTGCSSVLKNHDWRKDGEKIDVQSGQPVCIAVNGYRSTGGVQAAAVCCTALDLTCSYRSAGPSPAGPGTGVHTVCPSSRQPLGCAAWNVHSGVGGVSPSSNTCVAYNQDTKAGVYVFGACCSAPGMACVTVTSSPSGPNAGDAAQVQCDAGYVMTSCQVMSSHGKSSGAYQTGSAESVCQAFNGAQLSQGQLGVKAVATCCKMGTDELIGKR